MSASGNPSAALGRHRTTHRGDSAIAAESSRMEWGKASRLSARAWCPRPRRERRPLVTITFDIKTQTIMSSEFSRIAAAGLQESRETRAPDSPRASFNIAFGGNPRRFVRRPLLFDSLEEIARRDAEARAIFASVLRPGSSATAVQHHPGTSSPPRLRCESRSVRCMRSSPRWASAERRSIGMWPRGPLGHPISDLCLDSTW